MKILIGPRDKSNKIIMRYFTIEPGGETPYHKHDFEHVVKVEKGTGILIDAGRNKHELKPGMSALVEPNEEHQFKNPSPDKPFEFVCIVLNRDCTIPQK